MRRAAAPTGEKRLRPDLRVDVAAAEAEFSKSPDFSRVSMPPGFPDALRRTGKRFLKEFHSRLQTFENDEIAHRWSSSNARSHPPARRRPLASGGDRLDVHRTSCSRSGSSTRLVWQRLRTRPRRFGPRPGPSLRELAANRESLVATHLSFPVRLPCGGRRRRLSFGTGPLGVLTAGIMSRYPTSEPTGRPDNGYSCGSKEATGYGENLP